jgi:pyridoxamine 5'-phosphate oxidase
MDLADIRRDYGELALTEATVLDCPIAQFKLWFEEVLVHEKTDPTAMVLSTVDEDGYPDSRVVLLKALDKSNAFVFYTNYQSVKGQQIEHHPEVALNFYWPQMVRQVRIRGRAEKLSAKESDAYFASRPFKSQCSAVISQQSQVIEDRAGLLEAYNTLLEQSKEGEVPRPPHWGGYKVVAHSLEFWQGRDNRLHDRIYYYLEAKSWLHQRLAP